MTGAEKAIGQHVWDVRVTKITKEYFQVGDSKAGVHGAAAKVEWGS